MLAKKANGNNGNLKILMFGGPGTKKTLTALTFPKPLVLDLEKSTSHYSNIDYLDFYRIEIDSTDKELKNPITALRSLVTEFNQGIYNNEVETLIIDPVTDLFDYYEMILVNDFENDLRKSTSKKNAISELSAVEKTKWYAFRKRKFKALIKTILDLPVNVVFIARHKNVWGSKGGVTMPIGETYDGHDLLEYLVDATLHLQKNEKNEIIKFWDKSRLGNLNNYEIEIYDDLKEAVMKESKNANYFSEKSIKKLKERQKKIEKEEEEKIKNNSISADELKNLQELSKSEKVKYDNIKLMEYVLDKMVQKYNCSHNWRFVDKKYLPEIESLIKNLKLQKEQKEEQKEKESEKNNKFKSIAEKEKSQKETTKSENKLNKPKENKSDKLKKKEKEPDKKETK